MGIFDRQSGKPRLASLTEQGGIAAVYPSEDQLWTYGPPITDPSDQGMEGFGAFGPGSDPAAIAGTVPPAPTSSRDIHALEAHIDTAINGPTPTAAPEEEWVNLTIAGRAGFGDWQDQPYYTGHSQIVVSNPGAEQGWGVGPARRWMHYPFSELDNPTRNMGAHMRNGQFPWVYSEQNMLYYRTQLIWEQQWAPYKQRLPVNPLVTPAASVPFTATVPQYAGAPIPLPGIDIPTIDSGAGFMPDGSLSAWHGVG